MLNSWKLIQKKYTDWELLICGYNENNYREQILKFIKKNNLDRVILKDFVTGKDKKRVYNSSDLFILLSHSENFGLSIAEALSYEIPVITTTNTLGKNLQKYKCGWCLNLDIKIVAKTLEKAFIIHKRKDINGKKRKKLDD